MSSRKQRGQAMVEFTMVLPLLLLLSFGTLEVGLYLQRRVTMGGAAFVAARAAAVQGPRAGGVAREVLNIYAQDSKATWIGEAAGKARLGNEGRLLRLQVTRDGDLWTGALTGSVELTGGRLNPQAQWTSMTPMSQEFVSGGPAGKTFARQQTDMMVDYRAKMPWAGNVPNFGGMLSKVPGAGGANLALAINPTIQAAMANPQDRGGATSPSKIYVTQFGEEKEFRHAEKLGDGIEGLQRAAIAFYAAYVVPKPVPGGGQVIDEGMKAIVTAFHQADQQVKFVETSNRLEEAMHAFYGARKPRR